MLYAAKREPAREGLGARRGCIKAAAARASAKRRRRPLTPISPPPPPPSVRRRKRAAYSPHPTALRRLRDDAREEALPRRGSGPLPRLRRRPGARLRGISKRRRNGADRLRRLVRGVDASDFDVDRSRRCRAGGRFDLRRPAGPSPSSATCASAAPSTSRASAASGRLPGTTTRSARSSA